ncbi:hypothetical protein QLL95_gp0369 [Cotonvirus japonicus]|uniref:Ankyrin repeat protein n=1 Tax=Cotonvirus japonicus TaxID=2811091 RepID=A0ABM7NU92_9VIRU|nr:hypothetical protein QLL95_gp0369 [Cotonvirus japonicus]BCS83754.1 hypothetical protein [Cotonvirus japonicus]
MSEFKLKFCLNGDNRNEMKKHCKKTPSKCKLYVNGNKYIIVNFRKKSDNYYMEIGIDDVFTFYDFVLKNDLYCNCKNGSCNEIIYYQNYLDHIINNNQIEYIDQLISDFLCKNESMVFSKIYINDLFERLNYSCNNTIKNVLELWTMGQIIELCKSDINFGPKFIMYIMDKYKKNYCHYFNGGKKIWYFDINERLISSIIFYDNIESYKVLAEKIQEIIEELSDIKIKNSLVGDFDKCIAYLREIQSNKYYCFEKCLFYDSIKIAEFMIKNDSDFKLFIPNESILYGIIVDNNLNLLELLLDYKMIPKKKINQLFYEFCYNFSRDVVEILVNYDADVNKYGKEVIRKAKKANNYEVVDYLQEIVN